MLLPGSTYERPCCSFVNCFQHPIEPVTFVTNHLYSIICPYYPNPSDSIYLLQIIAFFVHERRRDRSWDDGVSDSD